jgi:hypothetical protein
MVDFDEEPDQEKRVEKLRSELEKLGGWLCLKGEAGRNGTPEIEVSRGFHSGFSRPLRGLRTIA